MNSDAVYEAAVFSARKHEDRSSLLFIIARQCGPVCGDVGRAGEGKGLRPGSEPKNAACKNAFPIACAMEKDFLTSR
jgi:hypothetical protein